MKILHAPTLSRIAVAMLLVLSPLALHAATGEPIDMSAVQLEPQEQNGISYLTGGIGQDESQAMQQTKGYNLHMTFSTGAGNEYLSGIDLVIQTVKGQTLLSLSQKGPFVYVKLPADKYLIVATFNGHEERRTVTLDGKSTGTLNFHWNDAP